MLLHLLWKVFFTTKENTVQRTEGKSPVQHYHKYDIFPLKHIYFLFSQTTGRIITGGFDWKDINLITKNVLIELFKLLLKNNIYIYVCMYVCMYVCIGLIE